MNKRVFLFVLFAVLTGITNLRAAVDWAYKVQLIAKGNNEGLVYISQNSSMAPLQKNYQSLLEGAVSSSHKSSWTLLGKPSDETISYYVWAQAARGYKFGKWNTTNATVNGTTSGSADNIQMIGQYTKNTIATVDLKEGVVTAQWEPLTPVTITYGAPTGGEYIVNYSYNEIKDGKFVDEDGNNVGRRLFKMADGAADFSFKSYSTDKITLTTSSVYFDGWYSDAEFTELLSSDKTYSYIVNGDASVYAKFSGCDDSHYGKVTAQLSSKSVVDGGLVCVSNVEGTEGAIWETAQNAEQVACAENEMQTYYLHAKSNNPSKYIFVGWYSDDACSQSSLLSIEADYRVTLTPTSKDKSNPTIKNVYARFIRLSEYYLEITALPNKVGLGMVYATTEIGDAPSYTLYSAYGSQIVAAEMSTSNSVAAATCTVYVHAYPKYGYKFAGWYKDAACTGTQISAKAHYAYQQDAESTDPVEPTRIALYAKFVADKTVNVTFLYPENGSYSATARDVIAVDGKYVWGEKKIYNSAEQSSDVVLQIYPTDALMMMATTSSGMAVKEWIDGSKKITSGSISYTTNVTAAKNLGVTIAAAEPFLVGNTTYSDLNTAISNLGSNTQITVVEDCWIPAGNYIIPNGVTLLIPKDSKNTIHTKPEELTKASTLTKYREVVLASGANLTINGSLCIDAAQMGTSAGANPGVGSVTGPYGCLNMANGGHITIGSTGKLYAFGFIFGKGDQSESGTITVQNGGEVYEDLAILDMHGGGGSAAIVNATLTGKVKGNVQGVFIFNQYYIQNVEPRMTFERGAKEFVFFDIVASGGGVHETAKYIGIDEDVLFQIGIGSSITKWYNANTDRQCYEMYGNITMNSIIIIVKVSALGKTLSISSADYDLPVNNMDITLTEGTSMTMNYNMKMLPGTRVTIAKGANLIIAKNLYLYDYSDWGYYSCGWIQPITATPGHSTAANARKATSAATLYKLGQAELVVDGTVTIKEGGKIYTTTGGANIYSHGTGVLIYEANATKVNATIYEIYSTYGLRTDGEPLQKGETNAADGQVKVGQFSIYYVYGTPIYCIPAVLRNADNTFFQTRGKSAGTTVRYVNGLWMVLTQEGCFYKDELNHLYTFTEEDDYTEVVASTIYSQAWEVVGASNVLYIHTADNCDWVKVNVVEATQSTTKLLKDPKTNIYYQYSNSKGYWEEAVPCIVIFKNYNGVVLREDNIYQGGVPTYKGLSMPIRPEDEFGTYSFIGWKINNEGDLLATLPAVNENIVFVAQYSCTPNVASVNSVGVVSYYTTWGEALAYINGQTTAPTLKLLADVTDVATSQSITKSVTLDLNGHELSGSANGLLGINAAGIDVTITDKSENQQGQISATGNLASGNFYAVSVSQGTLILDGGNIYGQNSGSAAVYVVNVEKAGTFEMRSGCIITTDASKVNGILTKTNNTRLFGGQISVPTSVVYISNGYSMTGKMSISGGWFLGNKIVHGGVTVPTEKVNIIGGYYSTNTNLDACVSAPYKVLGNDDTSYKYKVAEAYEVTWKNGAIELAKDVVEKGIIPQYTGTTPTRSSTAQYSYVFDGWSESDGGEVLATIPAATKDVTYYAHFVQTELTIGSPLDITDWTDNTLTINATGFAFSGWPYTVNGEEFGRENVASAARKCNADRTVTIPYTGKSGERVTISVTKSDGTQYSYHSYVIPYVYADGGTLTGVNEQSTVVVRGGSLTVGEDTKLDKIYVSPEAEVVVPKGKTLTANTVILRTTPWQAASLQVDGTINATKTYYTRIVSDNTQYFQFAIPLSSAISEVRLSNNKTNPYGKTWILKGYSESSRANNGASAEGSNWKLLSEEDVIQGTQGYELYSNSALYREFYFPVDISAIGNKKVVVSHTDGAAGAAHAGWNAICSPLLGKYQQTFNDASDAIKVSELTEDGNYWQHIPETIRPAVPFYYQAPKTGALDFSGKELAQNAPRRAWHTSVSTQWLRLMLNDAKGKMLDETDIFLHPEKFSVDYESGYDVIKQSTTGGKALLYSELAYGASAFAALPDSVAESRIPLTVYAAETKPYTFHLEDNAYLNRLSNVFLRDTETGAVIDLLTSDYEATLYEGTTRGRFYITCVFRAPNITTDVETTVQDKQTDPIQKVFYNGKVYILRNGVVYDLTGRQCEMK